MTRGFGFVMPTVEAPASTHPVIGASRRPAAHKLCDPRILDQLPTQRCMGYATAQGEHAFLVARSIPHTFSSPTFPWFWANRHRVATDDDVTDTGVNPYDFADACALFGTCELDDWDPPVADITKRPPDALIIAAQRRKIRLRPIFDVGGARAERILDALASDIPVLLAKNVDAAYMQNDGPTIIGPIRGHIEGAHATLAYGYDERGAIEANSWGLGWRQGGTAILSRDCLAESITWCATLEVET